MTKQSNALQLADEYENGDWIAHTNQWRHETSAELRRLHEVNQELLEALKMLLSYTKACEGMLNCKPAGQIDIAEAAIAKGKTT